jgi:hypothetical protein
MKLRSGKILLPYIIEKKLIQPIEVIPVFELSNGIKEEIKNLIQDKLNQLKVGVSNQSTYDYIITSILDIHTKHLSPAEVLGSLEKDIKYLADEENNEVWGCVYSLSTLINVSNSILTSVYYEENFKHNEELKIKVAGDIYDFIHDNN